MNRPLHLQTVVLHAVALALLLLVGAGCHKTAKPVAPPATAQPGPTAPSRPGTTTPPATPTEGSANPEFVGGGKRIAIVFGATENDPWTAAMLAGLANTCHINPLAKGATQEGLDTFGPYDGKLDGNPVELHIAMCDFSSTADVNAQQKMGELARKWVTDQQPDVVWLDGDPAQLNIGSQLDAKLPIVYSGAEVQSDVYYEDSRLVCGVVRKPSLVRTMAEVLKLAPKAKNIALVCDDSAQGLSRIKEIRGLENGLLKGMTFVTQPPVKSWAELHKLLAGLDKGIDAVIVTAMGAHGSQLVAGGKPCPADLLKGVRPPVLTLGPTSMDGSGALALRVKPEAHAQAALKMLGQILGGTAPKEIATVIPEEMQLYKNEK